MTGAWFVCLLKDVVQYFLNYTDPDNNVVWNELAVTAGLVIVVAFLQHLPPLRTLPSTMFLGTGYAFNQLATYVVDVLSKLADDNNSDGSTGQNAGTIFKVMFQVTYFGIMAFAVIRFDAWFQARKEMALKKEEDAEEDDDYVTAFEIEVANDIGDTVTHATAFVYGWGFSDTMRVMYFPFFNGCTTISWSSCPQSPQYPQVWYYAILSSIILGVSGCTGRDFKPGPRGSALRPAICRGSYMKQLSMQEYRSTHSKSYRTLMITAMSLTVGWGWMDVCNSTTTFFISEWMKNHTTLWSIPIIYFILLVFVYAILTEIYFQILDEMRFLKRERSEFQEDCSLEHHSASINIDVWQYISSFLSVRTSRRFPPLCGRIRGQSTTSMISSRRCPELQTKQRTRRTYTCLGTEKPIEEPEDHDLRSNDVSSQGFLPPITTYSSKTMAGLAESVAGWRLVGADWELK
eukprot:s323_g19.t1